MDDQIITRDYSAALDALQGELDALRARVAGVKRRIEALEASPPAIDDPALADQVADHLRATGRGAQ